MYARVLAATAAAFSLSAGGASAAVLFQAPSDLVCQGDSCFGIERGPAGQITIDSVTLDRALLGNLGKSLVRITFWTSDGTQLIGDLGDFMLSALSGEQLTLKGRAFTLGAGTGDLMFRIERLDFSGGGAGGGGGLGSGSFGGSSSAGGSGGAPIQVPTPSFGNGPPSSFGSNSGGGGVLDNVNAPLSVAVPEPGAWMLMLVGFGGLGALARRRSATQSV